MKAIIISLAAMLTVGCATQGGQQELNRKYDAVMNRTQDCNMRAKTDPDLQILNGKIEFGHPNDQTLIHYANTSLPTDLEKPALLKYSEIRSKCAKQKIQGLRDIGMPESEISLIAKANGQMEDALASLYEGKITYGDYAKQRRDIVLQAESSANALRKQEEREKQARDEISSQRIMQNLQAQQQLDLEQQKINNAALYNRANNKIDCTTTGYGGVLHTNCF